MERTDHLILLIFKKEPQKEFTTSEIIRQVYLKEYDPVKERLLGKGDKEKKRDAGRKKGALHRRILYHLNKLVDEHILQVSSFSTHGEKVFSLALEPGDYLIEKKQRKILISKPDIPSLPADMYEEKGIIHKLEKETWLSRANAILLDAAQFKEPQGFLAIMNRLFSHVNDVIGLNNFEEVVDHMGKEGLRDLIERLHIDTNDYSKEICIILDLSNPKNEERMIEFLRIFSEVNPGQISILFATDVKGLHKNRKIIEAAILHFSKIKKKINIQNTQLHQAPIIIGKAGVYTFDSTEWKAVAAEKKLSPIMICGQISLLVDVGAFYRTFSSPSEFRQMIAKAAKTLLIANRIRRTTMDANFLELAQRIEPHAERMHLLVGNYVRFWNYNLSEEEHFIDILKTVQEETDLFCKTEETIYKSCGIPIRFRITFSSKFSGYAREDFSERGYRKRSIKRIKDFEDAEILGTIETRERMAKIFKNADRVRFFRGGDFKVSEVVHEFSILFSRHEIPLFCYDFAERKGDLSLTQFME
ncbi:MAG: hypothetical protein ABIJ21_04735 [Nanoarchaeota archaeon]